MKCSTIELSQLAISDILEQADWYELQSGEELAQRWQTAVTSTLLRIHKAPNSGTPCRFRMTELRGYEGFLLRDFRGTLSFIRSRRVLC